MSHELTHEDHDARPGRLRRTTSAIGNLATTKTSLIRDKVADIISVSGIITPKIAEDARLAYIDDATGLPNRRAMKRRYAELLEEGKPFGAVWLDVNKFGVVNAAVGHIHADELMKQFSHKLIASVRGSDLAVPDPFEGDTRGHRTGGDEFVVLAELEQKPPSAEYPDVKDTSDFTAQERLDVLTSRLQSEVCDGVRLTSLGGMVMSISATMAACIVDPENVEVSDMTDNLTALSLQVSEIKKHGSAVQPA